MSQLELVLKPPEHELTSAEAPSVGMRHLLPFLKWHSIRRANLSALYSE
jgi:hypothetical protein